MNTCFKRSALGILIIMAFTSSAFAATYTASATGNWSASGTWTAASNNKTGTSITATNGSTQVTGVGTLFTTELSAGSLIARRIGASIGVVASIQDDTHLTLVSAFAGTTTTGTYKTTNGPGGPADAVVISNGVVVTVDANSYNSSTGCASLTFTAGTGASGVVVNSGIVFSVTGALTVSALTNGNTARTISGSGTLNCGSVNIGGASITPTTSARLVTLTSTITSFNITGNLDFVGWEGASAAALSNPTLALNSGTLNVDGQITSTSELAHNTSTLTLGASSPTLSLSNATPFPAPASGTFTKTLNGTGATVIYDATTGGQTVLSATYTNLTLSNTSGTNTAGGNLTVSGTFTTSSGGILNMGTNTLSVASVSHSGTIRTQCLTTTSATPVSSGKTWGGTVTYDATTGAQTVVAGTYNNLTLSNTSGTDATGGNLTVNGTFTTTASGILNMGTNTLSVSGVSHAGILNTQATASAITSGKTWGGTVNYNAASGGQSIIDGAYANLSAGGASGINTLAGDVTVSGTLTLASGSTFSFGTTARTVTLSGTGANTLSASGATIDMSGSNAAHLLKIASSSIANFGTLTNGTGNTVEFNGTAQTIPAKTFYNLTLSTSGNKTITSTVTVNGTLSMQGTAAAITGTLAYGASGILEYKGSGAQATTNIEFPAANGPSTLKINNSNSTGVTLHAARTVTTLTIGDVVSNSIFNDGGFQLTSTGTLNLTSGTFKLGTASATTFPAFATGNITAGTTIEYAGTSGTQTVSTTPAYSNLTFSGAATKTVATGTLSVGGNWVIGSTTNLNTNNPTVNITGNISGTGNITSTSGTLTINGDWSNSGTFTHNSGTVVFDKAGAQTVGNYTYNNLTLKSSGLKTTTTVTVNGIFSLEGTATISAAITFPSSATLQYKSGSFTTTNNEFPTSFAGNVIIDAGNGNTVTLNGSKTSLAGNLTVTSGTLNLAGFTVNRASAGGTLTVSSGATLKITGTGTLPSNYSAHSIDASSTIEYGGTSQTVAILNSSQTYGNLSISGSSTKTLGGSITVSGTISITNSTLTIGNSSRTLILRGPVVNSSGGINAQSGTLEFNNTSADVTLPSGLFSAFINNLKITGGKQVTLGSSQTINASLVITNSSKLGIGDGNTLTISGSTTLDASNCISGGRSTGLQITGSSLPATGTLYFDQSGDGYTNTVKDLTLNKTNGLSGQVTLGNKVRIRNSLTYTLGGTLITGGNLVIMSDADSTGRITNIDATKFAISGDVNVERYVPSKTSRRWLFVSSPVDAISVRNAWQDDVFITGVGTGGTACGSTSGNGTISTDKYNSNGFDVTTANIVSLYEYQQTDANRWVAIPNTSTTLSKGKGYRLLYRGARGVNDANCSNYLQLNSPPAPSDQTVNVTGTITTGDVPVTVSAKTTGTYGYTLIGNPYPSEIDFDLFRGDATNSTVISNKYWAYDPYSSSTNYLVYTYVQGIGPEVTGNSGGTITASNGNSIASGQAFFVESVNGGTATFKESFKTTTRQQGVYRTNTTLNTKIRVAFKGADDSFIDDAVIRFYNDPAVTTAESPVYDASNFNSGNFIASIKGNRSFSIQTRPLNFYNDTVLVRIVSATTGNFKLNFSEYQNFTEAAQIILLDLYSGTQTDVRLNPVYLFTITSNAATQGGRFKLVFRSQASVLPLSFLNIAAIAKQQGVEVSWKLAFEQNVTGYTVERSDNGREFSAIGTVPSRGNSNSPVDYSYTDGRAFNGAVYYRVKSNEASGAVKYSAVVRVNSSRQNMLSLYPNPARDQLTITFRGSSASDPATVSIQNAQGNTIIRKNIAGSNGNYNIDVSILPAGAYFITVVTSNGEKLMDKFLKY